MMKLKVLELFGGIGACTKALTRLGIDYELADYVEINKYAAKSFNAIHGTNYETQDIREWDKALDVDLIMHGSPCQDFSVAGLNKGGDQDSGTRSSLMYETVRIVDKLRPKFVVWENVKNLLSKKHRHNFDAYLEAMSNLGYTNYYEVLNAKNFGIPQNRERIFTVSIHKSVGIEFDFPQGRTLTAKLRDFLEKEVDPKYYITDFTALTEINKNYSMIEGGRIGKMHDMSRRAYNTNYISPTVHTSGGGNQEPKIVIYDDYNSQVKADQSAINTLTTNRGKTAKRNGVKIIEVGD